MLAGGGDDDFYRSAKASYIRFKSGGGDELGSSGLVDLYCIIMIRLGRR